MLHWLLQLYRVLWFEPLYGSKLLMEPPVEHGTRRAWPSTSAQLLSNVSVEVLALVWLCGLVVAPVGSLLLASKPAVLFRVSSAATLGSLSLLWTAHNLCRPARCRASPQWKLGHGVYMRPLELIVFITNAFGALTVDFGLPLAIAHFAASITTVNCSIAAAPWGLSAPGVETLLWRVTIGLGVAQAATSVWLGTTVWLWADAVSIRRAFISAMLPVPSTIGSKEVICYPERQEAGAGPSLDRDVAYGPEPEQHLDVYHSGKLRNGCPVALFVHGGGWVSGDKSCAESFPMLVELRRRGWVSSLFRPL